MLADGISTHETIICSYIAICFTMTSLYSVDITLSYTCHLPHFIGPFIIIFTTVIAIFISIIAPLNHVITMNPLFPISKNTTVSRQSTILGRH